MTTKALSLAPKLTLPPSIFGDVVAIVGRRGKGKTVTAKRIVEQAHDAGRRFCVVDPTGGWWGLKSSADGESPGLPCVIFGGDHADVPLEPTAGDVLGDFVADPEQPSCVLDVSRFTRGEQIRFLTAFMARVYQKNRAPLVLVLDEADQVAPQAKDEKAENLLLGATQRIVKLGRVKGFGVILVTQRPASLHKNVLTQASVLVTLGLTGPQDHKAVLEWIRYQADEGKAREILSSLPGLERGQAWVWAPEHEILKLVTVFMPRTFDSSATPDHGVVEAPRVVAEVDLTKLHAAIQATVERAKRDDPNVLHARIRELERLAQEEMHEAFGGQGLVDALREREERLVAGLDLVVDGIGRGRQRVRELVHELSVALDTLDDDAYAGLAELIDSHKRTAGRETEGTIPKPAVKPHAPRPAPRSGGGEAAAPARALSSTERAEAWENGKAGPRQRILNALAELRDLGIPRPPRVQLAFFAGYTHARSKGFANALGALRSEGLVDYAGEAVFLTADGAGQAIPVGRRRTAHEVQEQVIGQLGAVYERVLRPVLKAYPRAIDRDTLAAEANYGHVRSKGFANALGRMRTFGFITYEGSGVRATDLLFPR